MKLTVALAISSCGMVGIPASGLSHVPDESVRALHGGVEVLPGDISELLARARSDKASSIPGWGDLYRRAAGSCLSRNLPASAQQVLTELALSPENSRDLLESHRMLAHAFLQLGDRDQASTQLDTYLSLVVADRSLARGGRLSFVDAMQQGVQLAIGAGDWASAARFSKEMSNPAHLLIDRKVREDAAFAAASFLARTGDTAAARASFAEAVSQYQVPPDRAVNLHATRLSEVIAAREVDRILALDVLSEYSENPVYRQFDTVTEVLLLQHDLYIAMDEPDLALESLLDARGLAGEHGDRWQQEADAAGRAVPAGPGYEALLRRILDLGLAAGRGEDIRSVAVEYMQKFDALHREYGRRVLMRLDRIALSGDGSEP